jgi:predicted CoA-binding protein
MIYTDEKKESIVIFAGRVARELLKRGFTIIDIKPDKTNKIKTVFVFKREHGIEKVLADIIYQENEEIFVK